MSARLIVTVVMSYDGDDVDEYNDAMNDLADGVDSVASDIEHAYPRTKTLSVEATG